MCVHNQTHFCQPATNAFIPDFLFSQAVSEMSLAYCVRTVHKHLSAITETVIWDVVRGVPQSLDTISVRFPISFYQQFRYLFTFVHLSQILFQSLLLSFFFLTIVLCCSDAVWQRRTGGATLPAL